LIKRAKKKSYKKLPVGTPINGKNFYHRGHPLVD